MKQNAVREFFENIGPAVNWMKRNSVCMPVLVFGTHLFLVIELSGIC
jgi:hypothetical protein